MRNRYLLFLATALTLASAPLGAQALDGSRPDVWVTTKVKIALLTAEHVEGLDVEVDTIDGRVTLHGTVSSLDEKERAASIARSVEGVQEVRNLLTVVEKSKREAAEVSDAALVKEVERVLASDATLADSEIRVESVNAGVVLLSGEAATLTDHRRALEAAHGVRGVRHVAGQIRSPDPRVDEELWEQGRLDEGSSTQSAVRDLWTTTQVKLRLLRNPETPALDIDVDTRRSVVSLFGIVPSESAKSAAELEVAKVPGVQRVDSMLQVVPKEQLAATRSHDVEVRKSVTQSLDSRPDLADCDITVDVQNGIARLKGIVESDADRRVALALVRATDGVRSAIDELEVAEPESPTS